jgi:hypothetical protein
MKKIQIILLVLIIIGLGLIFTQKFWVDWLVNFILESKGEVVEVNDPLNLTYKIAGQDYQLVNGKIEKEIAPGSASKEVVMVFGEPVYADLDKDGDQDAVMFLIQQSSGSGTFFYVVAAVRDGRGYKGTGAMFLGDRIAPQNINIIDGRAVANFAERQPGESFATPPSVGKSVWIHLDTKNMELGEWVKDFEGESR